MLADSSRVTENSQLKALLGICKLTSFSPNKNELEIPELWFYSTEYPNHLFSSHNQTK